MYIHIKLKFIPMAIIKYDQADIIPIVITVLNFCNVDLASYGYRFVIENELPNLKDFVEEEINPVLYFEIMEASDHGIPKNMLKGNELIFEALKTLTIMHDIDLVDLLFNNERIRELSGDLYENLDHYADISIEDGDLVFGISMSFYDISNVCYFLCQLMLYQELDYDSFEKDGLMGTGSEKVGSLDTSNSSVSIVYDLIEKMQEFQDIILDGKWE